MKYVFPMTVLAAALAVPSFAAARQVTFETQMSNYGGDGAYVALYLTDRAGQYHSTLWVAGPKVKYHRHLRDWSRAKGGARVDGVTGASVGAGKTLRVTLDLADTLIDAGYEVRIDTAVEDMKKNPSEVVAPLTTAGANKAVQGSGYVKSFRYSL
ncbi:MAG: DUF2271 domain-containing protein [Burkholderiaceae bacterium]|jgi:hypothetical protein|nr:DUF2271 domain-containing protein [Burkholderiaceae bacterium]